MDLHLATVHRPSAVSDRFRVIARLALPIVGGMVSQNLLNLIDTAMVGSLGASALAAVGVGAFANFVAVALLMGLSVGVQALAARRLGEGRQDETALPLNGAVLVAIAFGVPLTATLVFAVPSVFPYLNGDPEVVAQGSSYLVARLFGLTAVAVNFAFRGYWNGVGLSGLYFRTLLLMHAMNVFLNWVFIFGHLGAPAMGALGAGVASAVATFCGSAYYFYLGATRARLAGFLRRLPDRAAFGTMLRVSVPSSIQQVLFAGGYMTLFWIFGLIGTEATAAANVVINLMLVLILPAIALGIAAASLVGQSLGRGAPGDAERWGWDVVRVASVVLVALSIPLLVIPDPILGLFLHDPSTLSLARAPLQIFAAAILLDGVGLVLQQALLGAGATRQVMAWSVGLQWGLFLPMAFVAGPVLGFGLVGIWLVQVGYRAVQAISFAVLWQRGAWKRIRV